jgi:hypothetical protein
MSIEHHLIPTSGLHVFMDTTGILAVDSGLRRESGLANAPALIRAGDSAGEVRGPMRAGGVPSSTVNRRRAPCRDSGLPIQGPSRAVAWLAQVPSPRDTTSLGRVKLTRYVLSAMTPSEARRALPIRLTGRVISELVRSINDLHLAAQELIQAGCAIRRSARIYSCRIETLHTRR